MPVSDAQQVAFHVSPSKNRDSITRLGLTLNAPLGTRSDIFRIEGQPGVNYLTFDLAHAQLYAKHIWERFWPRPGAGVYELDVWQVLSLDGLELHPDLHWTRTPAAWTKQDIEPERLRLLATIDPANPSIEQALDSASLIR